MFLLSTFPTIHEYTRQQSKSSRYVEYHHNVIFMLTCGPSDDAIPKDYFTSVDMSREPPPQADLTDLEPTLQNCYATYQPSPLHVDDEKWSVGSAQDVHPMYHHESNATFVEGSPAFPKPHKNTLLQDELEQELESSSDSSNDIDDDKDHDFDWNDSDANADKQSARSVKQNTTFQRARRLYRKYCFWHYLSLFMKRVVIAAIGSAIFITVGVCIYIYFPQPSPREEDDPNFKNIRDNVQVWMYWAAFMWHIVWLSTFITEAVPYIVTKWVQFFKGRRSEKVKSYMEVQCI